MIPNEPYILKGSDYYIYTPSAQALKTFFYPVCTGYSCFAPGYCLTRSSYDSFLIMHVTKGNCFIRINSHTYTATKNQIVILDCYKPHSYYTNSGWDAKWLHFDGPTAREYFQLITEKSGPVISLYDTVPFSRQLHKIYEIFRANASVKEVLISQWITNLLTELIVSQEASSENPEQSDIIGETTAYMNEHLTETLTLEDLASRASLSPYYFTRIFKKETGFTPHEYLIAIRLNAAKFLLKTTRISIKEICFCTGFTNESSFCSTFKKQLGQTPTEYRNSSE